jgi:FtsZ-binding cell division protein ZapB
MSSRFEQDVSFSIDMDELGVRPFNWIDTSKDMDFTESTKDYFGIEKTVDFTVYSAELQITTNGKKLTTNEDLSIADDDDDDINEYEIDPETGEKTFRETASVSNISLPSPPNDQWIEEYLSNIESLSNQLLPTTATTTNNSELLLENIPFSFVETTDEQIDSEWLSNLINLDENSESMMFTDPIISNQIAPISSSPIFIPNNHSSLSGEEEYSTSSSSSNSSRQQQSYSSLENTDDITFIETKLEKIEPDENPMSHIMVRRTSARPINQGQQDEETLQRYNIPLTLKDITQSSTDVYNRHLASLSHLSAEQTHIIKDIRRRGKNKIAAQNCRKRKAVSVESLLEEVDELKRVKHELQERRQAFQQQIAETRAEYEHLHHQVLPNRQLPPAIIVK